MNEIRRVLSAAAWRLWAIRALRSFIVTLSGAIVALTVLLVIQRIFGLPITGNDWLRIGAAGLGLAAVAALAWSAITRPRGQQVARELDERADLRESLSTALYVAASKDPWAAEVLRTARDKAVGVKVKQAIPITGPRFWPVPLALALVLVILTYTVPTVDILGLFKKRQAEEQQKQEVQQVKAEVQKDQQKLQELLNKAKLDLKDPAAQDGEDQKEPQSPEQIRRTALKKLTSLQEKLAEQKQGEKAQQLEALKQQMRQLKQPGPGPLDNMAKNMQKGDFDKAQKDLEELQKQLSSDALSPEQKQQAQEQVKKLAEQMKQLAEDRKELEKKLDKAGLKDPKQLAKNPEALKKALDEMKNLSEDQKKELMKKALAQASACKACQNMGQCMSQMAEGMSKAGMSPDAQQAAEKLAGQLSAMEMAQADLEAADMAMDEAMKQLGKLGGQCKGGNCDGKGDQLAYSDCQGPWKAGESAGKFGKGSGGPGISGGGMSPAEEETPVAIEKKMVGSKQTPGPIIGTKLVYGDQVRGEARAEFSAAVESSSKAATEAIDNMVVPRELQSSVKHYFGRLEARAKAQQQPGATQDHAQPAPK